MSKIPGAMGYASSTKRHCLRDGNSQNPDSFGILISTRRRSIMAVKSIPEGYHSVTPYLIIKGAAAAIDFYKKAFGATELFRFPAPGGMIGHAEIKIGDSPLMLADEHPDMGYKGPQTLGGSPVSIMIYVEDVDTIFNQAVEAGATVK